MSVGIDYGRGLANVDHTTGIRYGVISPHSPSPDSLEDVYRSGENLTYKAQVDEAQAVIRAALTKVFDSLDLEVEVEEHVAGIWAGVEDAWNDRWESSGDDTIRWEEDGYVLETSSLGIYVIRSPYFTTAAFCSPCCPGAGDLDSFREDGVKAYCLGHEWFEGEVAPYRVWQVSDGEELRRP